MMLQADSIRGRNHVDHMVDYRARPIERSEQWTSEWRLETEKYKAEAERLKGQVQTLKEAANSQRDEIRDKDITLNRQARELETMREELCKTKAELGLVREELSQSNAQKEKISSQHKNLNRVSSEEMAKLNRDLERSREEARDLCVKAERYRLQAEEAVKQQTFRLSKQLEELQKNQDLELQQLNASYNAELQEATKANSELQGRLQIMTSEVLQIKNCLTEVSAERDGLKEHLSQMRQAFETQSTTLHSLRNYIGQLSPENGEKKRLNDAVERLNKEKAALQTTTELLTIRLNSVNEILTLQEEKIIKEQRSTDPLVKDGSECLHVLQLWREKVFKLCVQLRTKDIELRGEKQKLLSKITSVEQELQQEQHRASVLQHSLDDKIAALDLERVEKETLKQDVAQAHKENSLLKLQAEKDQTDIKSLTEAVQRFNLVFENKVAEMDAAQTRFNICTQRLMFAKRRVETIQGLIMRRAALQKVQQSSKQAEQAADCIRNLQTELRLVSEERDNLTQELKRTPELIEKALSDLKEQYESRLMHKQQELEQSLLDVQQTTASRVEAQQSLVQIQDLLEEREVKSEQLRCELLRQQESSERALEERVAEMEERCAEKLKEMEDQVNTAKAEHTKAVMTLRHFERQAKKKASHMKEHLQSEHTHTQSRVFESGLMNEHKCPGTTIIQNCGALREQGGTSSQRPSVGPKVQLPADARLLSVLEELQSLSAAVVNSSDDSAEEEGQLDLSRYPEGRH